MSAKDAIADRSQPKRRYSLFPRTLEECITPVVRPVLKDKGLAASRLLAKWESIVGPMLSMHCYPEKLSFPRGRKTGGTLTVSVESGFATELQHLQPVIMERLASYFGYQAITRIAISHSWPEHPAPKHRRKPEPIAASVTESVEDDELRAALDALARSISGR